MKVTVRSLRPRLKPRERTNQQRRQKTMVSLLWDSELDINLIASAVNVKYKRIKVEPVELAITEITQLTTLLIKIDLAMMLTLH